MLDSGTKKTTTIKSPASVICETAVVWLNDIAGCFMIDRVIKKEESNGKTKTED